MEIAFIISVDNSCPDPREIDAAITLDNFLRYHRDNRGRPKVRKNSRKFCENRVIIRRNREACNHHKERHQRCPENCPRRLERLTRFMESRGESPPPMSPMSPIAQMSPPDASPMSPEPVSDYSESS
jgi:hypothetical protein